MIKINPSNVDEITKAMDTVIQLSDHDKLQRLQIAYNYISNNSTLKWAAAFIKELRLNSDRESTYSEKSTLFWTGVGLMATLNKTQADFSLLTKSMVFTDSSAAKSRLLILNHVGVLSTCDKDLDSITRLLNSLSRQDGYHVVLISPDSRAELDEKLGNACPKLILVAENGFFCKVPRGKGEWEDLIIPGDTQWHEAVIGIMQSY